LLYLCAYRRFRVTLVCKRHDVGQGQGSSERQRESSMLIASVIISRYRSRCYRPFRFRTSRGREPGARGAPSWYSGRRIASHSHSAPAFCVSSVDRPNEIRLYGTAEPRAKRASYYSGCYRRSGNSIVPIRRCAKPRTAATTLLQKYFYHYSVPHPAVLTSYCFTLRADRSPVAFVTADSTHQCTYS